jgi:hypothetical protein
VSVSAADWPGESAVGEKLPVTPCGKPLTFRFTVKFVLPDPAVTTWNCPAAELFAATVRLAGPVMEKSARGGGVEVSVAPPPDPPPQAAIKTVRMETQLITIARLI